MTQRGRLAFSLQPFITRSIKNPWMLLYVLYAHSAQLFIAVRLLNYCNKCNIVIIESNEIVWLPDSSQECQIGAPVVHPF